MKTIMSQKENVQQATRTYSFFFLSLPVYPDQHVNTHVYLSVSQSVNLPATLTIYLLHTQVSLSVYRYIRNYFCLGSF